MDVAHNPAAMHYLANKMQSQPCTGKTYAVIGMLKDKKLAETIKPLIALIDEWHSTNLESDRPSANELLHEKISSLTTKECYHHLLVADALRHLLAVVRPDDRIMVIGSFYTVSAAQLFIDEEYEFWKLQRNNA